MKIFKKLKLNLAILVIGIIPGNLHAQNLDIDILKTINPAHPTSLYWKGTSSSAYFLSGAAAFGSLIYGFADHDEQARQNAAELFLHFGISTLVSESLKLSINRTRPADRYPGLISVSAPVHGKSFPSGHSTLAFSTATTLALEYPKWYVVVPAYVWAGSVGYSRLYLGKHYPSDVLAGAAIGIGTGYISHWLTARIFKPYQTKTNDHEKEN